MGIARALLFGFLSWLGGVAAAEVGVTDNSILIGMTAPFSGPSGAYGLDMKMVINAYLSAGQRRRRHPWPKA
jgi:branched-chain amino acid transport system substrate-binding protein